MTTEERIADLEAKIEALNAQLPKHSVPPSMVIELEDLEDELAALKRGLEDRQGQNRRSVQSAASGSSGGVTNQAPGRSSES